MKYGILWIALLLTLNMPARADDVVSRTFPSSIGAIKVETVAKGLEHPWSMAFMPDGNILVTERPGRIRIVSKKGTLSPPVEGVPAVYHFGQGGLLDIALHPQFSRNGHIFFSYAEEDSDSPAKAGTAVANAVLRNNKLENVKVIFRQHPKVKGKNHFGSRLLVDDDEKLYITLGERFDQSKRAQDLTSHLGKIVRIETDGSVPKDNPFSSIPNAMSEIWSYGHRNIQGADFNPQTKQLWIHEHGPRGGDEINVIQPGKNYGWPEASYGSHYSMLPIPDDHTGKGFVEPVYYWTPSVAPSGMTFYSGSAFKAWKNHLFVGGLSCMCLIRLELGNGKIIQEERLLKDMQQRIRDVRQGPDGNIYLLTDSDDGQILKLSPAIAN